MIPCILGLNITYYYKLNEFPTFTMMIATEIVIEMSHTA
jgi:hypothetical protein